MRALHVIFLYGTLLVCMNAVCFGERVLFKNNLLYLSVLLVVLFSFDQHFLRDF